MEPVCDIRNFGKPSKPSIECSLLPLRYNPTLQIYIIVDTSFVNRILQNSIEVKQITSEMLIEFNQLDRLSLNIPLIGIKYIYPEQALYMVQTTVPPGCYCQGQHEQGCSKSNFERQTFKNIASIYQRLTEASYNCFDTFQFFLTVRKKSKLVRRLPGSLNQGKLFKMYQHVQDMKEDKNQTIVKVCTPEEMIVGLFTEENIGQNLISNLWIMNDNDYVVVTMNKLIKEQKRNMIK